MKFLVIFDTVLLRVGTVGTGVFKNDFYCTQSVLKGPYLPFHAFGT
jgi:hypothetical protein